MKVFKYSLSLLTFGLLFGGCSSTDEPAPLPDEEEVPVHGPAISSDAAKSAAARAMDSFGYMSLSRAEEANVSIKAYSSVGEDTAFYVVNYPEGGFVAVNADSWSPVSVLAISDKGELSGSGIAFLSGNRPGVGTIEPVKPITPVPVPTITEYSYPTPEWGIYDPYWKYCLTKDGLQSTVGDIAVAVGEILAYYKQPITVDGSQFDWSTADTDTDAVARLLHQVGVDMNANYKRLLCTINSDKIPATLKKYGFSALHVVSSIYGHWDDMLDNGPIVVVGSYGHTDGMAWVADGYRRKVVVEPGPGDIDGNPTTNTTSETYYHFNWGDDGYDNGMYWVTTTYDSDRYQAAYWTKGEDNYSLSDCIFYIPR